MLDRHVVHGGVDGLGYPKPIQTHKGTQNGIAPDRQLPVYGGCAPSFNPITGTYNVHPGRPGQARRARHCRNMSGACILPEAMLPCLASTVLSHPAPAQRRRRTYGSYCTLSDYVLLNCNRRTLAAGLAARPRQGSTSSSHLTSSSRTSSSSLSSSSRTTSSSTSSSNRRRQHLRLPSQSLPCSRMPRPAEHRRLALVPRWLGRSRG